MPGAVCPLDGTRKLDSRRDVQLAKDVPQVSLDRLLAEEQLGGDLGIRLAVDDEPSDLELASSQRFEPASRRPSPGACAGERDGRAFPAPFPPRRGTAVPRSDRIRRPPALAPPRHDRSDPPGPARDPRACARAQPLSVRRRSSAASAADQRPLGCLGRIAGRQVDGRSRSIGPGEPPWAASPPRPRPAHTAAARSASARRSSASQLAR